MQLNAYLAFRGDCEEAFTFYAECLGGTVGQLFRYGGTSFMEQAPAGWENKVVHGSLTVGDQIFMGADVTPDKYEPPKGFTLSLHLDTASEAERVFGLLSRDGRITMPLEKTFWAERFGTLIDRFGMPWVINGGQPDST